MEDVRMTLNTKTRTIAALACLGALASVPARAEIGETVGNDEIVDGYGWNSGNSVARSQFGINSWSRYEHDANNSSGLHTVSWSAPSARLLGAQITLWEMTADSGIARHRTDAAGNITAARGRIVLDGTTYFDCNWRHNYYMSECRGSRALNRSFVRGSQTFWVAGVVPVSFGGDISANVTAGATANSAMRPYSLDTAVAATDDTFGAVTVNGAVVGSAWATALIPPAVGASFGASVDFVRMNGAPRSVASRTRCATGAVGCSQDRRVSYSLHTLAETYSFRTFGGRIWLEGCLAFVCHRETLLNWAGADLGAIRLYMHNKNERFSSRY
jgi:hypothetical protein